MNKNETFYAVATQQGSSVKLEIRDTLKGNIKKTYRYPGKLEGYPIISGDTVTFNIKVGVYKKLISQNITTGKKVERPL